MTTRFDGEPQRFVHFDERHVPVSETRYDGQTDMLPPKDNEGYFTGIVWRPNPAGAADLLTAERAAQNAEPEPVVLEVAARATGQAAELSPDIARYMDGMLASSVHHA